MLPVIRSSARCIAASCALSIRVNRHNFRSMTIDCRASSQIRSSFMRNWSNSCLKAGNRREFSTSLARNDKESEELKEILSSELKFEQNESVGLEKFHEEWLKSSGFSIVVPPPTAKDKEVDVSSELVKETDTEIIHVYFNPLEVTNIPLEAEYLKNLPPEDDEVSSFEQEDNAQNSQGLFDETISNVTVIIEKKGSTEGLYFNLLLSVQTNYFAIGGLRKFSNIKEAMKDSAEDEYQRELCYYGPPFTNLDEYLQEGLMDYLNSRGIDKSLGDFISGYSLAKENDLYIKWLKDLKEFF